MPESKEVKVPTTDKTPEQLAKVLFSPRKKPKKQVSTD